MNKISTFFQKNCGPICRTFDFKIDKQTFGTCICSSSQCMSCLCTYTMCMDFAYFQVSSLRWAYESSLQIFESNVPCKVVWHCDRCRLGMHTFMKSSLLRLHFLLLASKFTHPQDYTWLLAAIGHLHQLLKQVGPKEATWDLSPWAVKMNPGSSVLRTTPMDPTSNAVLYIVFSIGLQSKSLYLV